MTLERAIALAGSGEFLVATLPIPIPRPLQEAAAQLRETAIGALELRSLIYKGDSEAAANRQHELSNFVATTR